MSQARPKAVFKQVASVTFCEKVGRRYVMEITTIDGIPYVNMAAYNFNSEKQAWVRDFKKNYFMPAQVFTILSSKWGNVSKQINDELKKCMLSTI